MVFSGLKTKSQIILSPWSFSWPPQFKNWLVVWTGEGVQVGISRYFLNSAIVLGGALFLLIIVASLAGYALATYKFYGKGLFYKFFILAVVIPIQIVLIPVFVLWGYLHLRNNYLGLIILYVGFFLPFSVLIMRANFESIPIEIKEAARIDGCTEMGVFWRIALPMSKPAIGAVSSITGVGIWGELLFAFILMNKPAMRTLNVGILAFSGQYVIEYHLIFAGLTISTIPFLILFIIFQRQIMKGMTLGAFK